VTLSWKIILFVWLVYAVGYNISLVRASWRSKKATPPSRGWGNRLRVLIFGATGGTGRQLVEQALEQGHQVTAFVRKPKKLELTHPNLRVVQGNVLDFGSVESAMQGQSAVVSALGHKRLFWPTKILSKGTDNIMRAMKSCHVPRLVCETSLGVGDAVGRLGLPATLFVVPFILPFYLRDRVRQEELIANNTELDWVIVRPVTLTNGARRGHYRHGPKVGNYIWPRRVSRADVAEFMLQQLNDDSYIGKAPGICY
jgi:putative NADH-flavin reductase